MNKGSKDPIEKIAEQLDNERVEKNASSTFSLDNFMDIKGLKRAERLFCKRHFKKVEGSKTIKEWTVLCKKYGLEL